MFQRSRSTGQQMPLALATAALLLIANPGLAAERVTTSTHTQPAAVLDAADSRIEELIKQLGSPQYTVRRAAANEIRKIGPEAFDQLHTATDDADPEIAASARYLLRQIAVRWTRSDDSATVRRLLRRYGDREDAERQRIIQMLSALPQREGLAGLCRVARFDRTPLLSRLAAIAIVQSDVDQADDAASNRPLDPAVIDRELGESTRAAALWLRQYQVQLRDPAASVAGWQERIEEEAKRLDTQVDETSPAIVSALLWNLADVHRRLGETQSLVAVADRMLATGGADADRLTATFLQWLVEHESWDALEQFSAKHQDRVEKSKRALYLVALARARQNDTELAEELAKRASQLGPAKPLDGVDAAYLMAALGQFDWAVREYQRGIDGQPIESVPAIGSRVLLSSLLQDYERYEEAADALAPLVEAVAQNRDVERAYSNAQDELVQQGHFLPEAEVLPARFHYLQACHFEQEHDYKHEREQLLRAIEHDETDADVLIAMYRLADADDAWMADTRGRIQKLSKVIEQEIDDNPNSPIAYNQWAWLIANTEGDTQKAVRYSRRSLELEPGTASFLDTLGRCYYAAGDCEQAIKHQREAVQLIPHMQVMQRQLAFFEKELAAKQKLEVGVQRSEKSD